MSRPENPTPEPPVDPPASGSPEPPVDPPASGSLPEPPTQPPTSPPSASASASPPSDGGTGRRSLWQRVFGGLGDKKAEVLLALIAFPATLIAAIAGLMAAFGGSGHSDAGASPAPPTSVASTPVGRPGTASPTPMAVSPSGTDSPGSAPSPAPTVTAAADPDAIQYTGPVRIAEAGPDLDASPPAITKDNPDVVLGLVDPPRISDHDLGEFNPPPLALWPGPGMPTRQQCADRVSTQGVRTVAVKKGTVVCVRTDAGRIAVLTITSTTNDFGTGELAQVSVWSAVSDAS